MPRDCAMSTPPPGEESRDRGHETRDAEIPLASPDSCLVSASGPAEKVKNFPTTPGVYLMKDAQGKVIYIGKAKSLRNRAATYFTKAAAEEHRTAELVKHIVDIDFLEADSEVDALLMEARLVKDVQPR